MGWFGKLTFGSLGMFLGGPLGAIAGAALGHHLVDKQRDDIAYDSPLGAHPELRHVEQTQAAYFISIFSILGKFAKLDGVVTSDEISVTQGFINSLPMREGEKQFAKKVFREAKDSRYSIEDFAAQFYQINRQRPELRLSFFDLLFQVAAADRVFHAAEEASLIRIKEIFQISDQQYNNIKSIYFEEVDKNYKLLNCTPESSNQEIKSSYKKLVKDFHPDRIVSKGLPEEFTEFATKRFREIQGAYEKIRRERNF
jgi:DnaJ like chaperone protein